MAARQITVERFNPDTGPEPYWQTYTVDIRDNQTILDALLMIADSIDPTLAFRRTCRSGICGSCAGRVNGRACLLCQLSISEAAGERPDDRVSVQALQGFTVLRDLVVDMDPFFEEFDRAGAWLIPEPQYRWRAPGPGRELAVARDALRDVRDLRARTAVCRVSSSRGCDARADPRPRPPRCDRIEIACERSAPLPIVNLLNG